MYFKIQKKERKETKKKKRKEPKTHHKTFPQLTCYELEQSVMENIPFPAQSKG